MERSRTATGRSVRSPLRQSRLWFSEGLAERRAARRLRRCVECRRSLASARTPYCSRACQWKFHARFFWDAARTVVIRRDGHRCRSCGRRAGRAELDVDHIVELAIGGAPLALENLQTLCRACHRAKTAAFLRARTGSSSPRSDASPFASDDPAYPEWFPA